MNTARTTIRRIAALSLVIAPLLLVACSSGGDGADPLPSPTPARIQPTALATPPPEPTPSAAGPVIVATPRAGSSVFNDPERAHTVSGFVLDGADGSPIRGVTVTDTETGTSSVSDEFGFYRIDGLLPGLRGFEASGYRVNPVSAEVETQTWTRLDLAVDVTGDPGSRRVFDMVGNVLDRNSGDPVEGAVVSASGNDANLEAVTDRFGAYRLAGAPEGTYELQVVATGYPDFRETLGLDGDLVWQVFLNAEPARVHGRLSGDGPSGARLPADAAVRAISESAPGRSVATDRVEPDGTFELEGLPPGRYFVEAFAPGYESSRATVELSGGDERELGFVLAVEGSTVHLNLTSSTYGHIPVAGTRLLIQGLGGTPSEGISLETETDANGAATFSNLPAGHYDIWTPGPSLNSDGNTADLYPLHTTVRIGSDETRALNFDMPAVLGDIHGFVRVGDRAGDTRIGTLLRTLTSATDEREFSSFDYIPSQLPDATIRVTSARFGSRTFSPPTVSVTSDGFGNYVLPLPPGTYGLTVTGEGLVTAGFEHTITSNPSNLDFQLQRATTAVLGRVDGAMLQDLTHLTEADFAVSGARVLLRDGDGNVLAAETDSRGLFTFTDVPLEASDGSILPTEYRMEITHPDYLPLAETVVLDEAEGAVLLVRKFPTLAAGGFLNISIAVTDKNGAKTAEIGVLESIQNTRTMDVYDARYITDATEVEIPHVLKLRARPGQYRARICPDVPGIPGCYDYFWSSEGGTTDELDLAFTCSDTQRSVKCLLDGDVSARASDHIQATGYVYSAIDGAPVSGASVTLDLKVLTEYCTEECTAFIREFSKTGPTGPNGRYQLEFEIPSSNGGGDLVGWSWDEAERVFNVSAPGFQSLVDTGPGQTARLFDGSRDFFLAPANRLELLTVGAAAESSPVFGSRPELGIAVGGTDKRASITLSPLGAELGTDPAGRVSFTTSSGVKTVIVNAPGHYPYAADVLVPDATDTGPVTPVFTLPIEQIPPPEIVSSSFQIASALDDSPLKGHVLRGLSSSETESRWSIRIDRNGIRQLRSNMEAPVQEVELIVHVLSPCPGSTGSPGASRVLVMRGALLSGDPNGVGTWGGVFDAAALPCGTLNWRVEARTSHSIVTESFDWQLWPSEQVYPLSLLTGLAATDPLLAQNSIPGPTGSDLDLSVDPGSLSVDRNDEYLKYKIAGVVAETFAGLSNAGRLLDEASGGGIVESQRHVSSFSAVLDGETGALEFQQVGSGEAPYVIAASALYALDSSVGPVSGDAGQWNELISGSSVHGGTKAFDVGLLPDPLRSTLESVSVSEFTAQTDVQGSVEGSWQLDIPSNTGLDEPVVGDRRVVDGATFTVVQVTEIDHGLSVMGHLEVSTDLNARVETIFASSAGSGRLREADTLAVGQTAVATGLWNLWNYQRSVPGYTYFERSSVPSSASASSPVEGVLAWTTESSTPIVVDGASNDGSVFAKGGLKRPSISAVSDASGKIYVAAVAPASSAQTETTLSIVQFDPNEGTWSIPDPLVLGRGNLVTDTSLSVTPDGGVLLVWSQIPSPDDDPATLIFEATRSELMSSRLNTVDGSWSEPVLITSDNRPDFSPAIASDGEGRTVLVWPRDMDGSVLTSDDLVVYSSDWIAGNWTVPRPVIPIPGAVSELSISVASGSAVVGVVTETPGTGRAVRLSFNSLGRWSPANVVASGRQNLDDVSVLMQSTGLALVAWKESGTGDSTQLVSIEATSAGVRSETVAADDVVGFVDLALVQNNASRQMVWVSDGGAVLNGSVIGIGGWGIGTSTPIDSGQASRMVAVPHPSTDAVHTIHESAEDGIPVLEIVSLDLR